MIESFLEDQNCSQTSGRVLHSTVVDHCVDDETCIHSESIFSPKIWSQLQSNLPHQTLQLLTTECREQSLRAKYHKIFFGDFSLHLGQLNGGDVNFIWNELPLQTPLLGIFDVLKFGGWSDHPSNGHLQLRNYFVYLCCLILKLRRGFLRLKIYCCQLANYSVFFILVPRNCMIRIQTVQLLSVVSRQDRPTRAHVGTQTYIIYEQDRHELRWRNNGVIVLRLIIFCNFDCLFGFFGWLIRLFFIYLCINVPCANKDGFIQSLCRVWREEVALHDILVEVIS